MNKLQMMNLRNHIDKVWSHGDYRKAIQIAKGKLGSDVLDNALAERHIVSADHLASKEQLLEGKSHDQYLYDIKDGATNARPISLNGFLKVVDSANSIKA